MPLPAATTKTLSDYLTQFVLPQNNDADRAASTIETYACYIRAFCRFVGKAAGCDQFNTQSLRHFRNQFLTETHPKKNTTRILVYSLRAFGAFLIAEGALPEPNPARSLTAPEPEKGNRSVVPDTDAAAFLDACDRMVNDERALFARAMLSVLIHAGLRYSEIRDLRLADVDIEGRVLHITHSKSGRARDVEICQSAADALREFLRARPPHCQADWFWMRNNHVRYSRGSINSMLAEVIAIAGKKGTHYTPHCFRHGYVTGLLMQSGADVKTVSQLVGHSSTSVTLDIYCHTDATRRRAVADLSAQRFPQTQRREEVSPADVLPTARPDQDRIRRLAEWVINNE